MPASRECSSTPCDRAMVKNTPLANPVPRGGYPHYTPSTKHLRSPNPNAVHLTPSQQISPFCRNGLSHNFVEKSFPSSGDLPSPNHQSHSSLQPNWCVLRMRTWLHDIWHHRISASGRGHRGQRLEQPFARGFNPLEIVIGRCVVAQDTRLQSKER